MFTSDFNNQTVPELLQEASAAIEKSREEKNTESLLAALEAVQTAEMKLIDAKNAAENLSAEGKDSRLEMIRKKIEQAAALKKKIFQTYDEIPAENSGRLSAQEFFHTSVSRR